MKRTTIQKRQSVTTRLVPIAAAALLVVSTIVAAPDRAAAQSTGVDLSVTKTAPDLPYGAGSVVSYTVTVEASGIANAPTVQLTDTIPQNMTFVSVEAPAGWLCINPAPGGSGTITCSTSVLTPGSMATFTINLRIRNDVFPGVQIVNTAHITSEVPDPVPGNNTSSHTIVVGGFSSDTAGVYDASTGGWFLKNSNAAGGADLVFTYGPGGSVVPLSGDWNSDGVDTPGIYDATTGAFFLKNTNASGGADIVFTFGPSASSLQPLSGDWNGDGVDTVGLYDPSTGAFFLKNSNTPGPADIVFTFGAGGAGFTAVTGDWNGDGVDTIGIYLASTATFFLKNTNASGAADLAFNYGPSFSTPVTGDWNLDGVDTVGVYISGSAAWFLRNSNSPGAANVVFTYGPTGFTGIVGDWNGS